MLSHILLQLDSSFSQADLDLSPSVPIASRMVYFKRWEEFTEATTTLYEAAPSKVSLRSSLFACRRADIRRRADAILCTMEA